MDGKVLAMEGNEGQVGRSEGGMTEGVHGDGGGSISGVKIPH